MASVVFSDEESKGGKDLEFVPTRYESGTDGGYTSGEQIIGGGGGYGSGGNMSGGGGGGGSMSGPMSFEDEPPLLEEIGINFSHIREKSWVVLNPLTKADSHMMDETDLAGPIVFAFMLGCVLLLTGKVQFSYIYGVGSLGCLSMYFVLNLMSEGGIDFVRTVSVLGYSLLPMVGLAVISPVISSPTVSYICMTLAVAWCTYSASEIFVAVLALKDQRFLIAYPTALVFASFALLILF